MRTWSPAFVALVMLAAAAASGAGPGARLGLRRGAASLPATRPASQPMSQAASRPASQPATTPAQTRTVNVDGVARTYIVYFPPRHDANRPTPVVLIYHGAWANGRMMTAYTGLNRTADAAGFVAVYPNGSGADEKRLYWNAFAPAGGRLPDDVKFTAAILDDLAKTMKVDARRVFATGISNGGMLCHRLAAELSDRIAAIAPISGPLCQSDPKPGRPVPVIYFHGTADAVVPFDGPKGTGIMGIGERLMNCQSVEETIRTWVKLDGCPEKPEVTALPDTAKDGTTVTRKVYGPGKEGAEVVLYAIEGSGHTWPGRPPAAGPMGKSTKNISANDLMWEFFQKHPMPAATSQPAQEQDRERTERNP